MVDGHAVSIKAAGRGLFLAKHHFISSFYWSLIALFSPLCSPEKQIDGAIQSRLGTLYCFNNNNKDVCHLL